MSTRVLRTFVVVAATLCALGVETLRAADEDGKRDASAIREFLEGPHGREQWDRVPSLVLLSSVMEYSGLDVTAGYVSTDEQLTAGELDDLKADLTKALSALTGGRTTVFANIEVETVAPGQQVKMFRRGQIVVGRFNGVRKKMGTVGYGGRTTRNAVITAGAVILDNDYDREAEQRLALRTHELGHALGYNHVASRQSVMNPRIGPALTDFDRLAIEQAFAEPASPVAGVTARLNTPGNLE